MRYERCEAITNRGTRCLNGVIWGTRYCGPHQEWRRGTIAGVGSGAATETPEPKAEDAECPHLDGRGGAPVGRAVAQSGAGPDHDHADIRKPALSGRERRKEGRPSATESPRLDRLFEPLEVADYLSLPVATLYRWRTTRQGPPAIRLGKHLRYRESWLRNWLEGLTPPS